MNARLSLCRGCMAYVGPVADNRPHRHHATQIVLALGRPFLLHDRQGARRLGQAIVAPDATHALDSEGAPVLVLLAEPSQWASLGMRKEVQLRPPATTLAGSPLCPQHLLQALLGTNAAAMSDGAGPDARIARVMALARAEAGTVRLADLALQVGLSTGRLTHLFARVEGISFKRWLLWDRMLRTVDCLAAGNDLTTAAHSSGFADSAHFSRSFRALFGIAASAVFRSRSVQVERCPIH